MIFSSPSFWDLILTNKEETSVGAYPEQKLKYENNLPALHPLPPMKGSQIRHPGLVQLLLSADEGRSRRHCGRLLKNECAEDFLIPIHYPLSCSQWISQREANLITSGQTVWKTMAQWFSEKLSCCAGFVKWCRFLKLNITPLLTVKLLNWN